jgi:hypothetical protein
MQWLWSQSAVHGAAAHNVNYEHLLCIEYASDADHYNHDGFYERGF